MVDLAKIRKKAKDRKTAEGARRPAPPAAKDSPGSSSEGEVAEVPASQPEPRPATPSEASPVGEQPEAEPEISKLERFKASAGQIHRFTNQVSRTQPGAEDEGVLELLTFVIATERYALEIEKIVEIIPPRAPTRVPNTDATILGIISLRGTIVTLLDVRQRLGHPPGPFNPNLARIIVIEQSGEIAGFLVDRVTRVIKLAKGDLETHPVVHHQEQSAAIRGVFQQDGRLTILLDLESLVL